MLAMQVKLALHPLSKGYLAAVTAGDCWGGGFWTTRARPKHVKNQVRRRLQHENLNRQHGSYSEGPSPLRSRNECDWSREVVGKAGKRSSIRATLCRINMIDRILSRSSCKSCSSCPQRSVADEWRTCSRLEGSETCHQLVDGVQLGGARV